MHTQKISVSIPKPLFDFIDEYQEIHHCNSRSEVINQALYLLQQMQLRDAYKEAEAEIDHTFDITAGDGVENETW